MTEELRKTGIDVVGDMPWGTHFCQFYETKEDLLDTLVRYFKVGLENNERCIWVIPENLSEAEATNALGASVPRIDRHLAACDIEIVSHADWYLRAGNFSSQRVVESWKERVEGALAKGYAGLRVTGDVVWENKNGWKDFADYESVINESMRDLRMTALCTYAVNKCGAAQVFDVLSTHQLALAKRNGALEVVETADSRKTKAEIERLNQELEVRVTERTLELATANEELRKEFIQRKRAQEELQASEQRLRAQYKGIPLPTLTWQKVNEDFVLIDYNDAAQHLSNGKIARLLGGRAKELYTEGREVVENMARCLEERTIIKRELADRLLTLAERKDLDVTFVFVPPDLVMVHSEDITERKHAEGALRKAEQKYRHIFENAGEGIFQTTPEGQYIAANPALARMHGFDSPEELIRSRNDISRQIYVDSARREEFKRLLEEHGVVRWFEHQMFRKDGSTIWISVNARAVRDEQGEISYYEGTTQDITDRKRTEAELIRQKEVLEKIVDHIPVMINFTGDDGRVMLVNREWQRTLGWSLEEALNDEEDIFAKCYPDPEYRQQVFDFIAAANGDCADFKTTVRSGTVVDTSWARIKLSDGTTIGIGRDITDSKRAEEALRKAEQKYRELFENAKDAIYVHDLNGRYTEVNPAAEKLSGYTRDEILGKDFNGFIAPEYVRYMRENLCKKLREQGEPTYEVEVIAKDGRRVPVEVSSRLIYEGGAPVGVQGTARDITERKRAEQELRTYSRRLIEAQEAERKRIARELHDEIGQVLTAVQINQQALEHLCEKTPALPHIKENIAIVEEALRQVRDLSLELRPSLLDDLGLAAAMRWYLNHFAARTGIKTQVKIGRASCRERV